MLFDYSVITPEWIRQRTDEVLAEADHLIEGVVAPDTPRHYETTLAPLDQAAALTTLAFGETAFMGYVHPDSDVRSVAKEVEERLQKWGVEVIFRDDLYTAVSAFAGTEEAGRLTGEHARLLVYTMRDLRKAGHELPADVRADVKRLTQRLVELGVAFQKNIDEWQDHLELTKDDLNGLPESYIEGLKPGDTEGTYRVSMDYPDVWPFIDNAVRRDLRQALMVKFLTQAVPNNRPLLEEAVQLRQQIAGHFGQGSWADFVLDERMAKNPKAVQAFYDDLVPKLQVKGRDEIAKMSELLTTDSGDNVIQVWDWRFYDTQLRKKDYGVDPMQVAAYFPLQQVLDGLLELTGEVFGLTYQHTDARTWHPDVMTYAIHDRESGDLIAHFHMDLYPREGKYGHAAAFTMVPGWRRPDGSYQKPVSAIVANFTKPVGERPSLLLHQEVETFFHEFGHILHQTLTKAELARFSGTSTERDFVEAPSQIMENWTWEPEVLRRFALHHQTGEPIPDQLIEQMVAARDLNVAVVNLRQVQFGLLDMALHGPGEEKDLDAILRQATEVALLPFAEGTWYPASFGHLFGYDAGYYGYLWSKVFGTDMWSRFEEEGISNPEVGMAYRRDILEAGGALDGDQLLRNFLGREPNNRAFLRRLGISAEDK